MSAQPLQAFMVHCAGEVFPVLVRARGMAAACALAEELNRSAEVVCIRTLTFRDDRFNMDTPS